MSHWAACACRTNTSHKQSVPEGAILWAKNGVGLNLRPRDCSASWRREQNIRRVCYRTDERNKRMIPGSCNSTQGANGRFGSRAGRLCGEAAANPGDEHDGGDGCDPLVHHRSCPRPLALATNWVSALGDTPALPERSHSGSAFRPSADSWRPGRRSAG